MYSIHESSEDKKAPLHFKLQDGVNTIQFLFRLLDEEHPENNAVYNYYNFPDFPQYDKQVEMIYQNINSIDCFTNDEINRIEELQSDIIKLKRYIYTELNCIIQLYNTDERKWTILFDNKNEKQNLQLKKFIFWGYEGYLKIQRGNVGEVKHKFIYRNVLQDLISIHKDIPLTTDVDIVAQVNSLVKESKILNDINKII